MPPQQQDGEVLQAYGHPKIAFFHLFWKVCLIFGERWFPRQLKVDTVMARAELFVHYRWQQSWFTSSAAFSAQASLSTL